MKLVSIIIPTYNRAKFISRAIESCLRQTYSEIEVLVVDDCLCPNRVKTIQGIFKTLNAYNFGMVML